MRPPGRRLGIGYLTSMIDDPNNAGAHQQGHRRPIREQRYRRPRPRPSKPFSAGFVAMAGNLAFLLNGIGLAVAFTILLVTANTMSIAVRERQQEIGVLKTLGFSSGLVMSLMLIEALLLGVHGRSCWAYSWSVLAQSWRCPTFRWCRRHRASVPRTSDCRPKSSLMG